MHANVYATCMLCLFSGWGDSCGRAHQNRFVRAFVTGFLSSASLLTRTQLKQFFCLFQSFTVTHWIAIQWNEIHGKTNGP